MLKIVHTYLTEQGQRVIVLEKFDAERACMWSRLEDKANADKAKADKSKAHIAKVAKAKPRLEDKAKADKAKADKSKAHIANVAKAKANQAKFVPSVQLKNFLASRQKARP